MRSPKISTKRVLGLALAAALAVGATVAVAGSSEAATAAAKVSPATGGPTSGAVMSITGKGFKAGSTVKALSVTFETAACPTTVGSTPGTVLSVVSDSFLTVKTPTLTASATGTKYFVCVNDATSGTTTVLGQGTYAVYTAPTLTKLNGSAVTSAVIAKDSTFGGSSITVEGANYTKSAKIAVAGTTIPTKFVDSATLTGVLPAHASGTAFKVSVVDLGGTVFASTPANASVSYVNAIKVTPNTGDGSTVQAIQVTGQGFSSLTFSNTLAASSTVIAFVPAGVAVTTNVVITGSVACGNISVVSDTLLTCQAPVVATLAKGSYGVAILTLDAASKVDISTAAAVASNTGFSSKAIYTVSDF
jgi:hypothetical protein